MISRSADSACFQKSPLSSQACPYQTSSRFLLSLGICYWNCYKQGVNPTGSVARCSDLLWCNCLGLHTFFFWCFIEFSVALVVHNQIPLAFPLYFLISCSAYAHFSAWFVRSLYSFRKDRTRWCFLKMCFSWKSLTAFNRVSFLFLEDS